MAVLKVDKVDLARRSIHGVARSIDDIDSIDFEIYSIAQ
jgi:hypothetical protein